MKNFVLTGMSTDWHVGWIFEVRYDGQLVNRAPSETVLFGLVVVSTLRKVLFDTKLRKEKRTIAISPPMKTTGVNHRNGYGLVML